MVVRKPYIEKGKEAPELPNRRAESSLEAAILAVATATRRGKHGQLCPVWTKRATVDLCDCWILRDAQFTAMIALDAASTWSKNDSKNSTQQ